MKKLPKKNAYDVLYALVQGSVGAIPIAGSPLAALFGVAISRPISKKRDAFLEELAKDLVDLRGNLEDFISKKEFVPSLIQGVNISLETLNEEKLRSLRNAIINSVLINPVEEKRLKFFNSLRFLGYGHITILQFLNDPYDFGKKKDQNYQELAGQGSTTLYMSSVFPEYDEEFINLLLQDLANDGLIMTIQNTLTVNAGGSHLNILTNYGKDFLKFLEAPSFK